MAIIQLGMGKEKQARRRDDEVAIVAVSNKSLNSQLTVHDGRKHMVSMLVIDHCHVELKATCVKPTDFLVARAGLIQLFIYGIFCLWHIAYKTGYN